MRRDRGFALLIVLWALVPLSLLFITLAASARSEAQLTANLRSAAELSAAADGAIETAIFGLLQGAPAPRTPQPLRLAGADIVLNFESLSGLVNPNTASPELLQALLLRLGAPPAQATTAATSITEWRTPGDRSARGVAKAAEYRDAGLDHGPPGAPFETLGELRELRGMTPALLALLLPHLTLYSEADPDPAEATPIVRRALLDLGLRVGRGQPSSQVVRITAVAAQNGARVARRAIIRVRPAQSGRGWRVLEWDNWFGA